ncbi:transporter [Paraburkholderia lacunae]|uniref:Transporter n=1 Tax=Paraburkholderia lacunae TaxID=2211104 RepID=A0A370N3B8_9BURK|nr:transporter [Paraburkholderia lacunae]RDK00119.1 transporter [Paraburkholderia lacunae]
MKIAGRKIIAFVYIALLPVPIAASAMVIETSPGDAPAIPTGIDLGVLYYQHVNRDNYYVNGNRLNQPFGLTTDVGIARWVHWTSLFGFTVTPQVIIPFGSLRLHSGGTTISSSGVGDPFVGSEIWFVNNPATKRYLALGLYVSAPLGTYDASKGAANLGSNRWVQVTHLSYSQNLFGSLFLDVTGEFAVYGTNNDFVGGTYKQRPTMGLQTHLRYDLSKATSLGVSYFHSAGGRSTLDGVQQSGSSIADSYRLSAGHFITPTVQFEGEVGQDIRVTNGAKENLRLNFRLTKVF